MAEVQITIPGATPEDLRRGAQAAEMVFRFRKVAPRAAAIAMRKREEYPENGFADARPLSDADVRAIDTWDLADQVAIEVVCKGWQVRPNTALLELA